MGSDIVSNVNGIPGILLMASLFVLAAGWIAFLLRSTMKRRFRHPRHASETCIPLRRLSMLEIVAIATGGRLVPLASSALAALLLTACLAIGGRFGTATALGMAATVLAIAGLYGFMIWRDCLRPLGPLPREGRQLVRSATFRYVDGAWQYVDDEWFIRLEEGTCCALHAPEIDFSQPIRWSANLSVDTGTRLPNPMAYSTIRAVTANGGIYIGKIGYCPSLERWVENHGGRME